MMMRTRFLAVSLFLATASCAGQMTPEDQAHSWIGASDQSLVAKYGVPANVAALADGTGQVWSYNVPVVEKGPSYEMPMPGVIGAYYTVNGPSTTALCRMDFTVASHKVTDAAAPGR
jgi:hypothetical protein